MDKHHGNENHKKQECSASAQNIASQQKTGFWGQKKPSPAEAAEQAKGSDTPQSTQEAILATRVKELEDMIKRLQAEFENYRKRVDKDSVIMCRTANQALIKNLLPVLDSFERALEEKTAKAQADEAAGSRTKQTDIDDDGLTQIYNQFRKVLEKAGVTPIESVGLMFDPYRHEVMMQAQSDKPEGTIIRELQKGYLLNGLVLRHSMVTLSKGSGAGNDKPSRPCDDIADEEDKEPSSGDDPDEDGKKTLGDRL